MASPLFKANELHLYETVIQKTAMNVYFTPTDNQHETNVIRKIVIHLMKKMPITDGTKCVAYNKKE